MRIQNSFQWIWKKQYHAQTTEACSEQKKKKNNTEKLDKL